MKTPTFFSISLAVCFLVRCRRKSKRLIHRVVPPDVDVHPQVRILLETGYYNQRSSAWLASRMSRLTASDAPAVLGTNPYRNRNAVFKLKTTPVKPSRDTWHTLHGKKYESEAVQEFSKEFGKHVYDFGLLPHPTLDWLGASPDGICSTGEMVEVKCPTKRPILKPDEYPLGCPVLYYSQVQLQLEVAQLDSCYFVQYRPETFWKPKEFQVSIVKRDATWWQESLPQLREFWQEVLDFRETHPDWNEVDQHPVKKRRCDDIVTLRE